MDDGERARRRAFVAEHRTAVFGYPRRDDGPSMSVVYYVMDGDEGSYVKRLLGGTVARGHRSPSRIPLGGSLRSALSGSP